MSECISESDCIDHLLRAGCPERVIAHARAVRRVVDEYTGDEAVLGCLAECGALLHDIGRSKSRAIDHAIIGGDICREAGISEDIALIVERHLGAGQTADECIQLGLTPRNCMPVTLPEKIVAHADNLVKGTSVIHIDERMIRIADLPRKKRHRTYHLALEMELFSR
ncbi:HD domain-containing protein [Methanocalculus sp.]|uniref:HD domain-containing protein n=1 Tax=Methanocalculus sp. TaxID=2004547 RepID=UPI00271A2595|nr:HD domain-containing protein [Methanocalculus sp.]MDO8842654.1 HD domain-containing protein [Methanocalculus sp.]